MSKVIGILSTIGVLTMAATPLLAVGGFAHAEESQMRPVRIAVGDLNLAQPQDAATFTRRVDRAAETFCLQNGVAFPRLGACRQAVHDEAVERLTTSQQQDLRTAAKASTPTRLAAR